MSTKNVINYKQKTFRDISGQLHTQEHKTTKKTDSEASTKWKEVKGKPEKINYLILKIKADQKEGPNNL